MLSLGALWSLLAGGPEPQGPLAARAISSIVIDSRQATPGSLFVALQGEKQDGHDYAGNAFERGAAAALISRPVAGCRVLPVQGDFPEQADGAEPLGLLVPDVLCALQELAAGWRKRHAACRMIAVTGSVGKTSAKEAIAAALASHYSVLKSAGNHNNEIGLPLTLLNLEANHERAVLEMGMYALGEIARLVEIAAPQVGVVTNVGPIHLERLGSIEAIAQAKAELAQGLPRDGVLVLNGDDERVRAMAEATPASEVVTYGLTEGCDLRAESVESRGLEGIVACFRFRGREWTMNLPWLGRHNVYAALAAAAVGLGEGLSPEQIATGLAGCPGLGRLRIVEGAAGATILDDSYNASPASTLADLDLLNELDGRRLAVLGDMLELGSYEEQGHREVGRRAAQVLDVLVTVGARARWIADEARRAGSGKAIEAFEDRLAAAAWVRERLRPGDWLLIKASRAVALEDIVAVLSKEGA